MVWLIPLLSFVLVIILLISLLGSRNRGSRADRSHRGLARTGDRAEVEGWITEDDQASPPQSAMQTTSKAKKFCVLCSSPLEPGQSLKTRVIEIAGPKSQGSTIVERRAEIMGCPHCWPNNSKAPRTCPVCQATLGAKDLVYALYYEKQHKRNHLHVRGCTQCRPMGA